MFKTRLHVFAPNLAFPPLFSQVVRYKPWPHCPRTSRLPLSFAAFPIMCEKECGSNHSLANLKTTRTQVQAGGLILTGSIDASKSYCSCTSCLVPHDAEEETKNMYVVAQTPEDDKDVKMAHLRTGACDACTKQPTHKVFACDCWIFPGRCKSAARTLAPARPSAGVLATGDD